jgi:hypothetical protein
MEPRHSEVATRASRRHAKYDSLDSELPEECRAVGAVLSLVGDKWSMMVIVILGAVRSVLLNLSVQGAVYRGECLRLLCADWSATVS